MYLKLKYQRELYFTCSLTDFAGDCGTLLGQVHLCPSAADTYGVKRSEVNAISKLAAAFLLQQLRSDGKGCAKKVIFTHKPRSHSRRFVNLLIKLKKTYGIKQLTYTTHKTIGMHGAPDMQVTVFSYRDNAAGVIPIDKRYLGDMTTYSNCNGSERGERSITSWPMLRLVERKRKPRKVRPTESSELQSIKALYASTMHILLNNTSEDQS